MNNVIKNVIVTGGSRGLGLGTARRLAAAGYRVIALARRDSEELRSTIAAAATARAGEVHFRAFDLADIDAIAALVREIRGEWGKIHGLVNNAALGTDGLLAT